MQARLADFSEPEDVSLFAGIEIEIRSRESQTYTFGLFDRDGEDTVSW